MPNLSDTVSKLNSAVGVNLDATEYRGFLSKRLTLSSSLAVQRAGHGYHIEITNPTAEMLVFPIVTSSKYEAGAGADSGEKRRFFLRLDVRIRRENLRRLIQRQIDAPAANAKYPREYYEGELVRIAGSDTDVIKSFTHCTFQIRTTGQRQLEVGTAEDGHDFITLRNCLPPEDYLVFLQLDAAEYDVVGVPNEALGGADIGGWEAGSPGRRVIASASIESMADQGEESEGVDAELGEATERKIAEVVSACERHGMRSIVALAGVPGTGKSYIASLAARRLAGTASRIREIQFHSSFTYEEFIEGMRIGSGGSVVIQPGIFLELNARALSEPSAKFVLLIEELTRANVASVLGELLTYVEHRDREFYTMYGRKKVRVAPNLTILATYNPLDRSAIDIDSALLRRLRVISFPPSRDQLAEMLERDGVAEPVIEALSAIFKKCEDRSDYEAWMPFGHGIFAGIKNERPDLFELWTERIRHFLYRPGLPLAQICRVD